MKKLFKSTVYFTVLYTIIVVLDIYVKTSLQAIPYRFITKPLVVISLISFYWINRKHKDKKLDFFIVVFALVFFLIGDLFLIESKNNLYFGIGMFFFIIAKFFLVKRFTHQRDFKMGRLLIFLFGCFLYIMGVSYFIYYNLRELFIPVLIYFFASITVLQFAFLRKNDVNTLSYRLVFSGTLLALISDTITGFKMFYMPDFPMEKFLIMFFYSLSQYLIFVGLVKEVKKEEDVLYA